MGGLLEAPAAPTLGAPPGPWEFFFFLFPLMKTFAGRSDPLPLWLHSWLPPILLSGKNTICAGDAPTTKVGEKLCERESPGCLPLPPRCPGSPGLHHLPPLGCSCRLWLRVGPSACVHILGHPKGLGTLIVVSLFEEETEYESTS